MTELYPRPAPRPFQIDRTVSLGLLITMIVQMAGGLVWAGSAAARLATLEAEMDSNAAISERLARLEGLTSQMAQSVSHIERELIHDE
jgi:hypothetical protein